MTRHRKHIKAMLMVVLFIGWAALVVFTTKKPGTSSDLDLAQQEAPLPVVPLEEAFPYEIVKNSTLFSALTQLGVNPPTIQELVQAAKPLQDLTKLRPGIRFQILQDAAANELVGIRFRFSAIEVLDLKREANEWKAEKQIEQVDIRVITFSGTVNSSLWESAQKAKMDPNLISELADIFGWEVDFSREVRVNDRWRLSVEQKVVRGEPIGWGSILAAEYVNAGEVHQASLFRSGSEDRGYFKPDGTSLRRMFLKSPIRYARITSGFRLKRFHPVLQVNRPHLGVDYAAPIGTPIRAVGSGTITMAGWNGGAGNMIKLRHNGTYQTAYKHLSRFATGIRAGTKVQQGQVIGYVGNTGLSTGPHLHFEFYQGGRYVDPLGKKFPSADPVPSTHLAEFKGNSQELLESLPAWPAVDQARSTASTENEEITNK